MSLPDIRNIAQGTPLHLSTGALPMRDRLGIWLEFYGHKLFNLEIQPFGDEPFRAEVTLRSLPGVSITTGARSNAHYRIRNQHLKSASDMVMLVAVLAGRGHSQQRDREALTLPGQAVMMLTSEQATHTLVDSGRYLSLYLPRASLASMAPGFERLLVRSIDAGREALRLLIGYAGMIGSAGAIASPELQRGLAAHIQDLLALTLADSGEAVEIARGRGLAAARLTAIRADVAANLRLPGLSAEDVARRQGLTPDYVRKLFRGQGTSFADYVLDQRLLAVHKALCDPRLARVQVAAIAYDAGFADISYFNRRFRQRFGATSTDVRHAALASR
ncbi:helix-turn-helix domain-containing protein [bacterium M00.F.Ca.ET.230.01.1.1]|nr:helix-turn-helix domain-containing protein [bacterium M00.F.Ca.ET.230.01.1.1]